MAKLSVSGESRAYIDTTDLEGRGESGRGGEQQEPSECLMWADDTCLSRQ